MSRPVVAAIAFVLRVACMNIPTKVGRDAWEANFRALAARSDIFGINEAGSWRAKLTYRRLARELGYGYYGLFLGSNPVFWDTRKYRFHSGAHVKLHGRDKGWRARRWPGFNAARYVTVVSLQPLVGGPLVVHLCWHFVAPGRKVRAKWRARMRKRSIAKVRAIVAHHRGVGRIVTGSGDANLHDPFPVVPGWVWLRGQGVDKLGYVLPEGVSVADGHEPGEVVVFRARTDHKHGVSAAIHLEIGAAA